MRNNRIFRFYSFAGKRFYFPAIIIFILCSIYLSGCYFPAQKAPQNCIENRAAFDIGSSTMKLKTARVDACTHTITDIVYRKDVKIPFSENAPNHLLSEDIENKGIEQLIRLRAEAQAHGAQKFAGVATAVFRQSSNTPQFLAELENKTGIHIHLISQDEEAILGYRAATTGMEAGDNVVVWDIGGNSMQIIARDRPTHYVIYRGNTASISFKNLILTQILGKSPDTQNSPNPIGLKNLDAALAMATRAANDIPVEIKNILRQKDVKIFGIGGIHNQSIRNQMQADGRYTRDDLMKALQHRISWTDAQIGGSYASTDVSNLILVLGFMTTMDIDAVDVKDVNLADGVLIEPSFWQ
jgi:exopolyphosphatase / guanosine-5'-triphosphate,3'-diphosphate pyrophosphatase